MRKLLLAFLAIALVCSKVQAQTQPNWPTTIPAQAVEPDPKCDKYQHVEHTYGHCANTCDAGATICTTECMWIGPSVSCIDDMHAITEKDWQDLMSRLETLEMKGK